MTHQFDKFPALDTPRLSLVELTEHHCADLFAMFTNPHVTQYFPVIPMREEKDLLKMITLFKDRYAAQTGIRWGIVLQGQDTVIGTAGFNSFTIGHKASLVYALHPNEQGKGLITEALQAILQFGFEELNVNRIEAEVMPGNTASEKVLGKLEFIYEGLLREWMYWQGIRSDIKMYSLLASEWGK